jgi:hypothetical protein
VIQAAAWHDLYGVERAGVVLVRPDGCVAWRSIRPTNTSSQQRYGLPSATVPTPQTSNGTLQLRPSCGQCRPGDILKSAVWVSGEAEMDWGTPESAGQRHYDVAFVEDLPSCVDDLESALGVT